MDTKKICLKKISHSDDVLVIEKSLENKIRLLCSRFPDNEWSGILFYTKKKDKKNRCTITCKDLFLMDIGSSVYTEFELNADVINYMSSNMELLDCNTGLIHSHNRMSAFFSGTDLSTLQDEGSKRDEFLSLIVNNEGTYTAAITNNLIIRSIVKEEIAVDTLNDKYEFNDTQEYEDIRREIQYSYLNIVYDKNPLSDRIDYLKSLHKDKKENQIKGLFPDNSTTKKPIDKSNKNTISDFTKILILGTDNIANVDPNYNWDYYMKHVMPKRLQTLYPDINDYIAWAEDKIESFIENFRIFNDIIENLNKILEDIEFYDNDYTNSIYEIISSIVYED